jgi:DNA-directed RNA polymerase specialized sigma24 family protein
MVFNPIQSTITSVPSSKQRVPEKSLVVELICFQGYPHEEVSIKLRMPLGPVKFRIRKVLSELSKFTQSHGVQPEQYIRITLPS